MVELTGEVLVHKLVVLSVFQNETKLPAQGEFYSASIK